MNATAVQTISIDDVKSQKRHITDDESARSAKRFKCEPCNISFTEHKSLLRHQRENKKHRLPVADHSHDLSCDLCQKTFSRSHDLDRHTKEQHSDGKTSCTRCGKRIRQNAPHRTSTGVLCTRNGDSLMQAHARAWSRMCPDFSRPEGIPANVCESIMDSLTCQMSTISIGQVPMSLSQFKKQVRTRKIPRLPPCGICRMEFEFNDAGALIKHLKNHFEGFIGRFSCDICEINFVHEEDLETHKSSAAKGNCGFKFKHNALCTGHHPPGRVDVSAMALNSDDDRFNFAYRLRTWEQSQLLAFLSSLKPLVSSKAVAFPRQRTVMWSEGIRPKGYKTYTGARHAMSDHMWPQMPGMPQRTKSKLLLAVTNGVESENPVSEEIVKSSLSVRYQRQPRKSSQDDFFHVMLCEAVSGAQLDIAAFAIACGADLNGYDQDGHTALHIAAYAGDVNVASLLLEAGANIGLRDSGGEPPLMSAVRADSMEVAKLLVCHGAVEESIRYGPGILHAAFPRNFVSAGVIDGESPQDDTIIQRNAEEHHSLEKLSFLIENGALIDDVNEDGVTALMLAAGLGHLELVKFLLEKNANLAQEDFTGNTALSYATAFGHFEIATTLIGRGALVLEAHLLYAIRRQAPENLVMDLLDKCVDVQHPGFGCLALPAAIHRSSIGVVQQLVERGSAMNLVNKNECFHPLVEAARSGRLDVFVYLLVGGARLDVPIGKQTVGTWALCRAAEAGNVDFMQRLLSAGVKVNDDTFTGNGTSHTMLCRATRRGQVQCARILVENGADLEARCSGRHTALYGAIECGQSCAVQCLLSFGAYVHTRDDEQHSLLCKTYRQFEQGRSSSEDAIIVRQLVEAGAGLKPCEGCGNIEDGIRITYGLRSKYR